MHVHLEISGLDELEAKAAAIPRVITAEAVFQLSGQGRRIETLAKALAPHDTQELANGIHALPIEIEGSFVDQKVVSDADYTLQVEYGTGDTRPQPFLRPAVIMNAHEEALRVGSAIVDAIARLGDG